jgi:outer membrane protein assembly factor BamB
VLDDTIYVGVNRNRVADVYALDASDGTERWSFDTIGTDSVNSSPSVADGRVYVGNNDGRIYAFEQDE